MQSGQIPWLNSAPERPRMYSSTSCHSSPSSRIRLQYPHMGSKPAELVEFGHSGFSELDLRLDPLVHIDAASYEARELIASVERYAPVEEPAVLSVTAA